MIVSFNIHNAHKNRIELLCGRRYFSKVSMGAVYQTLHMTYPMYSKFNIPEKNVLITYTLKHLYLISKYL